MSDEAGALGEYVLLEVVGRGSCSTVHRARHRARPGRIVAVKHLQVRPSEQALERLRHDGHVLAALDEPAIAPLLDVVVDTDGTVALVTPYAAGGSLQDVLERGGSLPWWRVADVGVRVASALAAAHGAGVVHGGITPANVLLGAQDMPLLTDFGTAALRHDERPDGEEPTPDSDVHRLGAVLHRALTDRVGAPPAALVAVVEQAVARQPVYRFDSAASLRTALEPFASLDEPTQPHAVPAPATGEASTGELDTADLGATPWPEPAGPDSPTGPGRPAWVLPLLAGAALAALLAVAGLWLADRGADGPSAAIAASPAPAEATPRQAPPRCAGVEDPRAQGQVLEADVDGRGCTLPLLVTEEIVDDAPTTVVMVPTDAGVLAGRYALGEAGGRVVVGDWDCDGTDTPAVVRTSDGQVFLFDGYGDLVPTPGPALPAGTDPQVMSDEAGCDHVTG